LIVTISGLIKETSMVHWKHPDTGLLSPNCRKHPEREKNNAHTSWELLHNEIRQHPVLAVAPPANQRRNEEETGGR
jgi:hypothetical protein